MRHLLRIALISFPLFPVALLSMPREFHNGFGLVIAYVAGMCIVAPPYFVIVFLSRLFRAAGRAANGTLIVSRPPEAPAANAPGAPPAVSRHRFLTPS